MKLALLDDYHRIALEMADWARLAGRVEVVSFDAPITDAAELVRKLAPFDAILAMRERTAFPRALLEQLPKLRLLITTGMWNASIDIAAAAELGIQVCGTRDVRHLTAELTLGLILALARQTPHEERALRQGRWQVRLGQSVRGRTLGLLGLGNLGRQVAAFGRMLGMQPIAWSQNLSAMAAAEAGCRLVERDELFRAADYLSIHVRLSDRTRGLVGVNELELAEVGDVSAVRGESFECPAILSVVEDGLVALDEPLVTTLAFAHVVPQPICVPAVVVAVAMPGRGVREEHHGRDLA